MELVQSVQQQDSGLNEEALEEFVEHRAEIKKPMTPLAIKKATKFLLAHSFEEQARLVDHCILNGWRGLYYVEPPKQAAQETRHRSLETDLNDTSWAN